MKSKLEVNSKQWEERYKILTTELVKRDFLCNWPSRQEKGVTKVTQVLSSDGLEDGHTIKKSDEFRIRKCMLILIHRQK